MKKYNDDDSDEQIIKRNPFKKLEIKIKKHTAKRNVSIKDIRSILHMSDQDFMSTNFARDVFMLSFLLVGMNPIDLYNVDEYRDGRISYKRHKTANRREDEAFISIKVEPEVVPLVEKYLDVTGEKVFNFHRRYSTSDIFSSNLNKGLKRVQEYCGIDKNLTMYVARHSWATIARNDLRSPVDDIAQCLNHIGNEHKTTWIYIEKDFSLIDRLNRRMIDLLHSIKCNNDM